MDIDKIKKEFYKYSKALGDDNVDFSVSYYSKDGRKITLTHKRRENATSKKKINS